MWPSRGALLTGYYAQQIHRDGLPALPGGMRGVRQPWARLLPDFFKPAGYRCYHSGKWHIDGKVLDSGFDRSLNMNNQGNYFSAAGNAIDDKPVKPATNESGYYATALKQQFQIKGLALCKMFYLLDANWNVFMIGDNCLDTISFHTGFSRHTVERYIKVWKALLSAPKHLVAELEQKSVNVLIPVANAIAQGEEITERTWDRVVDAPDANSVRRLLNEELDREERSNKLTLKKDRKGSLWAYTNNGFKFIGSLEVDDDDDIVQAAIERIIKRSGVMKQ